MSISLTINSEGQDAADFTIIYSNPIPLPRSRMNRYEWRVALTSFKYVYDIDNINPTFNNHTFEYSHNAGVDWNTVTIPAGTYSVSSINDHFKNTMKANGHYTPGVGGADDEFFLFLGVNNATFQVIQEINDAAYRFRFTTGDFYKLIGATAGVISTTTLGPNNPDLNRGVTSYNLNTDIVTNTFFNGSNGTVLHNFLPNDFPGSTIEEKIVNLQFLTVDRSEIRSIRIWFTDQLNRPISFNDNGVTVCLRIDKFKTVSDD